MRRCEAPDCSYDALRGSAWCYFHSKVADGLITDAGMLHRNEVGGEHDMRKLSWRPDVAPAAAPPRHALDILMQEWDLNGAGT